MKFDLSELRNRHQGETLWVLGGGPSLRFVDPSFFIDKTTVAASHAAFSYGVVPDYVFSHHWTQLTSYVADFSETIFVLNKLEWPTMQAWDLAEPSNLVLHVPTDWNNAQRDFDPFKKSWNRDSLVFGSSSLHGAMHLAAHLGASNLILVGADNSRIDGFASAPGHKAPFYGYPIVDYENHLRRMKNWLATEYGVSIHSLNPFVNLHLEGHKLNDSIRFPKGIRLHWSRLLHGLRRHLPPGLAIRMPW